MIYLWSDGARQHLKQNDTMYFWMHFQDETNLRLDINFFESYNGHNVCDGHARTCKGKVVRSFTKETVIEWSSVQIDLQLEWILDSKKEKGFKTVRLADWAKKLLPETSSFSNGKTGAIKVEEKEEEYGWECDQCGSVRFAQLQAQIHNVYYLFFILHWLTSHSQKSDFFERNLHISGDTETPNSISAWSKWSSFSSSKSLRKKGKRPIVDWVVNELAL